MSARLIRGTLTVCATLALAGCASDATAPGALEEQLAHAARPADACLNVQVTGSSTLGLWSLNDVSGFGAVPFRTAFAGIDGWMASAVDFEYISGSKAQGAHHIFLSHYFWGDDGSWFRTDDRASCAAADDDPMTCQVNDHMRLVEGGGVFSGATGQIHNHGWLRFSTFGPPPAGTIDLRVTGRICGNGL